MTVTIRRACTDDADGLKDCIAAAYAKYADLTLPDVTSGIEKFIASDLVWVAARNCRITGGNFVSQSGDRAHLRNLAVHPDLAGQGIGSELIRTAIAHLKTKSVRVVELATHVDMPQNAALYTHLGWRETGRDGDKVIMSRSI